MWWSVVAVSSGAVIGANLRWLLGLWLHGSHYAIAPGTLLANLIGGGLAGLLLGYFTSTPGLASEWRLFAITGICGALTTFSAFSLEMLAALQEGRWQVALAGSVVHVVGSVAMAALGLWLFGVLRGNV